MINVVRNQHLLVLSCLLAGLLSLPADTWAASKAWLIDENGEAVKVDLSQNTIAQTRNLPIERILLIDDLAADPFRGNLFVPHGRGPYAVMVLDLKTLARKGQLDFVVDSVPGLRETIRFIFPPTGGEFFARRWNAKASGGTGAIEVVTINAATFKTTASRVTSPPLAEKLMLDATGRQLYSMTEDKPARIDVFDVPSFTRTSTIDLEAFLNPTAFGRGIDDFARGKILINENEKTQRSERNSYTLFVFDVASNRSTPKIRTGLMGDATLLPRTNRLLFNEKNILRPEAQVLRHGDLVTLGRIHVYDAVTGNRLATAVVSGVQTGLVLGVNPAEDIFYYFSFGPSAPSSKLSIISLNTFSVIKELALPLGGPRMVVFDE